MEQVFKDFEKDLAAQLFALNYGDNSQPENPQVIDFKQVRSYLEMPILEKSLENLAELDEEFLADSQNLCCCFLNHKSLKIIYFLLYLKL